MTGADVKELQKILIGKGFLKVAAPTTYFGQATKAAVKAFQKANGLAQIGIVGPQTRALLNSCGTSPQSDKDAKIKALQDQLAALLEQIKKLLAAQGH